MEELRLASRRRTVSFPSIQLLGGFVPLPACQPVTTLWLQRYGVGRWRCWVDVVGSWRSATTLRLQRRDSSGCLSAFMGDPSRVRPIRAGRVGCDRAQIGITPGAGGAANTRGGGEWSWAAKGNLGARFGGRRSVCAGHSAQASKRSG